MQPVAFVYNQGDNRTRYEFIAEETASVDAHLATYDASGTVSGIDDRSIIAILVGAVQDLARKLADFADRFVTKELVFDRAYGGDLTLTHQLCIEKSDGTPVCVTGDQLASVLASQGFDASASNDNAAASLPLAATLVVNGNNPATCSS